MDLYIEFRDTNDVLHREIEWKFNENTTVTDLKDEIHSCFCLRPSQQQLFLDGTRIRGKKLQEVGVKDQSTIVVKHVLLDNWNECLSLLEVARKAKQQHLVKRKVDSAMEQINLLRPSGFFFAYTRFNRIVEDFVTDFAHYLDNVNKYLTYAAESYFTKLFHDDPEHPEVRIKCRQKEQSGAQATVQQLCERVKNMFYIQSDHQQIFVEGNQLFFGKLTEGGVKDRGTIVVKHLLLENWDIFRSRFNDASKARQDHKIREEVHRASNQLRRLQSSGFFTTYPRFDDIVTEFRAQFARYLDNANKYLAYAAEAYFTKLYHDDPESPEVRINCRPKENCGAQGELLCEVYKRDDLLGLYHVKTHLGIASRSSNHDKPDMRELFVYRLLELIHVGPEVHFLPNTHGSSFGLYIATKDIMGFCRASDLPTMEDHCRIERDLLREIFYLTDLHSANYGLDSKGNLYIVDFQISCHDKAANAKRFLHGDRKAKLRVAKQTLDRWNLAQMITEADARIGRQKMLFQQKKIAFKPSENYAEYLDRVNQNVSHFVNFLKKK